MTVHSAVALDGARLRLLGPWQLLADGTDVALGHREQRMIALLGLVDHTARAQVASAMWPESTDARALASLRRAVLQCQRRCPGLLVAERLTIRLDPGVRVDVDDLRRAAGLTHLPMSGAVAHELLEALRGEELLPGWYDDWVVTERERLQGLRLDALEQIALHGLEHGDLPLAEDAARTAAAIDPLRESVREISLRAHLERGDVAGAVHEFRRYAEVMQEELGVAPSSRLSELLAAAPATGHAEPTVVTLPRPRVPLAEARSGAASEAAAVDTGTMSLDAFLGGDSHRVSGGVRHVGAALVGAAGLALAVAVAVAVAGPEHSRQATTDPGAGVAQVLPPSAGDDGGARPQQRVRVRAVPSAAGTAAFAVRATQLPAEVRLVVRGRAGMRVVRLLTVREEDGRQVVVDNLGPGTYQWSATSASAQQVAGEVSVATPAVTADGSGGRRSDPPTSSAALGAVVGDSALFLLARRYSRRFEQQVARAKADDRVREALRLLDSSAPALIVGGRYLPGMRFVVNATMGLSAIRYPRFLIWSAIGGTLWSVYTCVLAYAIGIALAAYPLASFVISGLFTTVVLGVVFLVVRRQRRRAPAR